eukprot:gnl/TRDRNA2_/TRDRNA2_174911_c3_seq4.p1 gnl/TRDRNA2_/TRDRNA2_174911_c3~~gnl/TRDRNA2_/TRDRNA2_174911_c3_seq4.p1  ORF type:complete len:137 (-),score=21.16 gnl/TRDRNA2_/TRDRNA2_174911_c3_seq4:299-709(-)
MTLPAEGRFTEAGDSIGAMDGQTEAKQLCQHRLSRIRSGCCLHSMGSRVCFDQLTGSPLRHWGRKRRYGLSNGLAAAADVAGSCGLGVRITELAGQAVARDGSEWSMEAGSQARVVLTTRGRLNMLLFATLEEGQM